jgi:hypothetical protein
MAERHCRIRRRTGDEFAIHNLGSLGATVVNGLPVTERVLMHGDEIRAGHCRFVFLQSDSGVQPGPESISAGPGQEDVVCRAESGREDCSFRVVAASSEQAARSQTGCSLTTMLRIATGLRLVRKAESIAQQLLDRLFEVVPAEHGGVLLFDGQSQEPSFVSCRDRETAPTSTVHTYRALVDQARREVKGILAVGVLPDPGVAAVDLSEARTRSVLVAPIIVSARTLGVVYLDSCVPSVHFIRTIWSWLAHSAPSSAWP